MKTRTYWIAGDVRPLVASSSILGFFWCPLPATWVMDAPHKYWLDSGWRHHMTATVLVIFRTDASDLQIYLLSFSAMACLVLALEFVNDCYQAFFSCGNEASDWNCDGRTTAAASQATSTFTWLLVRDQVMMGWRAPQPRGNGNHDRDCAPQKLQWQTAVARASGLAG